MFTPLKTTGRNLIDVTVLSTPQPQATSTVQRKSTLESKYSIKDERKRLSAQRNKNGTESGNSSLGILNDISSFLTEINEVEDREKLDQDRMDLERELARKLLRKCSEGKPQLRASDTDKENNVNIQNLTKDKSPPTPLTPSTPTSSSSSLSSTATLVNSPCSVFQFSGHAISQEENTTDVPPVSKSSTTSVVFEPQEITARSSGMSTNSKNSVSKISNNSSDKNSAGSGIACGISFDASTAELMAQFNNEEFRSASQVLTEEASWRNNSAYSATLPVPADAEKEYLDLSCFSGIIGELDLSIESCAGRKVSVGEFFKRKCGNLGELSDNSIERPSLGFNVKSPMKKERLISLVDSSVMTEASSTMSHVSKESEQHTPSNATKEIDSNSLSIMSLSSIAQALQDIDNGTPRRLVDQLIMAKKKKKYQDLDKDQREEQKTDDTYTVLPIERKSMPATPSASIKIPNEDVLLKNFSSKKLSLDSKIINETTNMKDPLPRMLSFSSDIGHVKTDQSTSTEEEILKKEIDSNRTSDLYGQTTGVGELALFKKRLSNLTSWKENEKSYLPKTTKTRNSVFNEYNFTDKRNEETETEKKETVKEENVSHISKNSLTLSEYSTSERQNESQTDNIVIGRNTEELCSCIVGISRETDIEFLNKSDRWIICSLSISQIQGDKQNILLTLPKDIILIKPNASELAKVNVKVLKLSKPIIAVLNITVSDIATRSEQVIKHIVCFKPEEPDIRIVTPSQTSELDFQYVEENRTTTLPVLIENKNSIRVPVKLSISHNGPKIFSIHDSLNGDSDESENLIVILKPQESVTVNVKVQGIFSNADSTTATETRTPLIQRYEAHLVAQVEGLEETLTIQDIFLIVRVGHCKIEVIDTELPLIVPKDHSKPLNLINSGNVATSISASFVQDEVSPEKDFVITPESIFLHCNERGTFLITYKPQAGNHYERRIQIKLTAGNNVYHCPVVGEHNSFVETENNNLLRCETPQHINSVSSPTSPHSVTSFRTGTSGRNSPSSSISGATVTGDKITIRATHASLVWNTVKAGKSETKEFTIRNTSNNKIRIQAVISDSNKSFKFLRERQAGGTSTILTLQGTESRTLSVTFSPHECGAVAGKITFRHYQQKKEDNESRPSRVIFLYGYGGYGNVEITEAFKDISGKMWLSLGTLNSIGVLNAKIRLENTGDLSSYAKIKLTPKAIYPAMISSWHISPTELILAPNEVQWVTLEFRPRKEDLALLQRSDVSHVGTVHVIHGDEPTRWRIRRLYNKMKETGELSGSENEAFRNIVYSICKVFPGEQLISDLSRIRDSVQNLGDLCRGVRQYEILLTMEIRADETLSLLHDNADDTEMFYSLCSDNSHLYESDRIGESFLPSETMMMQDKLFEDDIYEEDRFVVKPSVVTLNPLSKTEAILTVLSSSRVAQPFETILSHSEYLSVLPAEGMIPTGRGFPLKVRCRQTVERNVEALLEIFTENSKQEVTIKIVPKKQ